LKSLYLWRGAGEEDQLPRRENQRKSKEKRKVKERKEKES
jgi:hypothetical protein